MRSILPKLPYDPDRDILPVAQVAVLPGIPAVTLSLPVKSVEDLIAYARKNPGKLLFASSGNGSSHHLAGELFKRMTGTQMTHVPYKLSPQAVTDLIGGQVHLMFDNASSIVKEKFATAGNVLTGGTPEEFAAFIKREVTKWAEVIKGANIKAD